MVRIDPWAYLLAALLVLTLPLSWLLAALSAAVFHEACHMLAIKMLGGRVTGIRIGPGGAVMETELPGKGSELLSALAGPVGSLLLLSLCHIVPKLAICAAVQGLFNLLPLYPLDGGRILRCCLELCCPSKAERRMKLTEILLYFALLILAVAGIFVFSFGLMPLIVAATLILKAILRKRPCKQSQIRVQ